MKKQLLKLVDVKSIMTLMFTIIFAILSITHNISSTEFMSIFTMIIGFYFGVQSEKKNNEGKEE